MGKGWFEKSKTGIYFLDNYNLTVTRAKAITINIHES